jgi:hypothetical protein
VHQVTQGPIYGGHPNSTPTPSEEGDDGAAGDGG